ncbi:hypothetical protein SDC9_120065 [bioreactor metagenome]|uniref:Uncharacterized protein n=1 Tax=bioreactor metagenome TaxID=1076179 RepID=A0A645C621_9ZZZZ
MAQFLLLKNDFFMLFHFLGDETLSIDKCLFAQVVLGDFVELTFANFNVETKNLVVANF